MTTTSPTSSFQPHTEQLVRWLTWTLRHRSVTPEVLRIDAEGWVDLETVMKSLPASFIGWTAPTVAEFSRWILSLPGGRFEICRGRIRALYGHSLRGIEVANLSTPPKTLYHGTDRCLLEVILTCGLQPMGRNRVHLTADLDYASRVARKFAQPVVLLIDTVAARRAGVQFFASGPHVWQVARIASDFLSTLGIPTDNISSAFDAGEI